MKSKYTVHELLEDGSFHQFLADPASEEGQRWQQWLAEHPEQASVVKEARHLLTDLKFRRQSLDETIVDDAWQSVRERMQQEKKWSYPAKLVLRIAATLSLLLLAGFFYWHQWGQVTLYDTGYGEIRELLLEDGTVVQLNANSSIRYRPENLLKRSREVFLEGEAFFDVSHRTHTGIASRFLVHTENGVVEVLGTRFNVQSRHQTTQVVLESGKVTFETRGKQKATLNPGEMLEYSGETQSLKLEKVNPRKFTAWREQKLYFDETPLAELAEILEDTYGKQVVISDSVLRGKKLSGEISADDMDKVLLAVSRLFSVKIKQSKDTIFFESFFQ